MAMQDSDLQIITGTEDREDEVRDKRPRFGLTARTHRYWTERIADAAKRLKLDQRAAKARKYRERYGLYQNDPSVPINSVSRKLVVKVNNTVQETPVITPHFRESDDEQNWSERLTAFMADAAEKTGLKKELRQLCWDNYFAGIGWARVDFQTRFAAAVPQTAREEKRQVLMDEQRIEQEHAQALAGVLPQIAPDDPHGLDLERHESRLDELMAQRELWPEGTFERQAVDLAINLLLVHVGDHRHADERVEEQKVVFRRWPPFLVVYDPDALRWEDCDWYAIEMVERKEVLQLDPLLKNVKKLQGAAGIDRDVYLEKRRRGTMDAGGAGISEQRGEVERYIRYWLIHDRLEQQMIVVAETEQVEQLPLLVAPWPYPGEIVRPLVLRPVIDQVHGVAECSLLESVHDQLIDVARKIKQYVTAVPAYKFFILKKLMNREEFKRHWRDPTIPWVPIEEDEAGGIKDLTWPGIDKNLLERELRLENMLDSESGIPEYAQAETTGETATMTSARDRMMGAMLAADKESVAELVQWWCTVTITIWREQGTTEQFVRIVGDQGRSWARFSPEDIPHGVTWLVDSDSLAPTRRELEKKQAMELLSALTPYAVPEPLIHMRPILASLIRKFQLGPEDQSELFVSPQEQMMQQMAAQQAAAPAGAGAEPLGAGVQPEGLESGPELASAAAM